MKSRSEIWLKALEELGNQCSVDTARDAETCERRATQEGDSFFKVTLPQFAKDLEGSLAAGHIPASSFTGWARRNRTVYVVSDDTFIRDADAADGPDLFQVKVGGGIPRFLGGFMELVFADDRVVSKSTWNGAIEWILHESTGGKLSNQDKRTVSDLLPPALFDILSDEAEGRLDKGYLTPNESRVIEDAASAIHAIRQLCLMFSKEKELPAQRDIDNEIARFVEIDEELEETLMQGVESVSTGSSADDALQGSHSQGLPQSIDDLAQIELNRTNAMARIESEYFDALAAHYREEISTLENQGVLEIFPDENTE